MYKINTRRNVVITDKHENRTVLCAYIFLYIKLNTVAVSGKTPNHEPVSHYIIGIHRMGQRNG